MPINIKTNLDNTEKLVEAPEFIELFKQSNSPWANFFPIEIVNSTKIEFIIKVPKNPPTPCPCPKWIEVGTREKNKWENW